MRQVCLSAQDNLHAKVRRRSYIRALIILVQVPWGIFETNTQVLVQGPMGFLRMRFHFFRKGKDKEKEKEKESAYASKIDEN